MASHAHSNADHYYVPHGSHWPIVGSIGLFTTLGAAALWLEDVSFGPMLFPVGIIIILIMMFGWFGTVIRESEAGAYNQQVERLVPLGHDWFIFSEVMFFAAFFGALFYARTLRAALAGRLEGKNLFTKPPLLWNNFEAAWPTNGPAGVGGAYKAMEALGIPALNTAILITSGLTVTIAHWGLKTGDRRKLCIFLALTVALGFTFVALQAHEYHDAYVKQNLNPGHGQIYGFHHSLLLNGLSTALHVTNRAPSCCCW